METTTQISPSFILLTCCCIWPALAFALGVMIGRVSAKGFPFKIIRKSKRDFISEEPEENPFQ